MIIIADSSTLISTFVETDQNHKQAINIKNKLEKQRGIIYTPTEVFSETINIVGKKLSHTAAIKLGEVIMGTDLFFILSSSDSIRSHALAMLKTKPASVSFTDCLVMAFADEYETKDIFGFDETFRKNGYKRVGIDK